MDRLNGWLSCTLVLAACCGWVVPTLGQSATPAPDPRAIGIAEAMRDYCAKAYPASLPQQQFQVQRLINGLSAEALAQVRRSEPYRRARIAESEFVGKIDPHNAKRTCVKSLVKK